MRLHSAAVRRIPNGPTGSLPVGPEPVEEAYRHEEPREHEEHLGLDLHRVALPCPGPAGVTGLAGLVPRHLTEVGRTHRLDQRRARQAPRTVGGATSGWCRSNAGRSERIRGMLSKLCRGGGHEVAHSSDAP